VRTRLFVAAPALIAAAALVAIAGPANSSAPGIPRAVVGDELQPLTLDLPAGAAMTAYDPRPDVRSAAPLGDDSLLVERVAFVVPDSRPVTRQPAVTARAESKLRAASSGRGWRRAEYSWYGPGFYGSGTACGQTYTTTILGVANKTLPCGTRVTLRNPGNGRQITVRVIDRGPYVAGRMWDLSRGTCQYLGNCYTSIIQWRLP